MDQKYHFRSRSSTVDVADARDVFRAQFPCRLWLGNCLISPSEEHRAVTNGNIGAGAFMKRETLRGVDGRILRQGARRENYHRHSGATAEVIVSSLMEAVQRQREEETLTAIRTTNYDS